MRKCPICKKEKETPICPVCGFDESLDYRSLRTFSRLSAKNRAGFLGKKKTAEWTCRDHSAEKRNEKRLSFLIGEAPEKEIKKLGPAGGRMQQFRKAGISVPDGFVLTTDAWKAYEKNELWGKSLNQGLMELAVKQGKVLGDPDDPLVFSVHADGWDWRSEGAALPNVGLNDETVNGLAKKSGDAWMAWDSYRRLIRDFAVKLHGAAEDFFLLQEEALLTKKGKKSLAELGVEDMKLLVQQYKTLYNLNVMSPFPQELSGQLLEVIRYFYEKGEKERENRLLLNGLPEGTAILVQTMVFGNRQINSGSGFVRTGERNGLNLSRVSAGLDSILQYQEVSGNFLRGGQAADLEKKTKDFAPLSELKTLADWRKFRTELNKIEKTLKDPYILDFTVENGKFYFLSVKKIQEDTSRRVGKMSPTEEVKTICQLVDEGRYTERQAAGMISEETLENAVTEGLELGCVTRIRYWKKKYSLFS